MKPRVGTLALGMALTLQAAAAHGVMRTVEFRDGTVIQVELPDDPIQWHTAAENGEITKQVVDWPQLKSLYLVSTPPLERLAEIRRLLDMLASNRYAARVEAHRGLIEKGVQFRRLLEVVKETTSDPEVRWRLDKVLHTLPSNVDTIQFRYDLLQLSDGRQLEGDVGPWSPKAKFPRDGTATRPPAVDPRHRRRPAREDRCSGRQARRADPSTTTTNCSPRTSPASTSIVTRKADP